MAPHQTNRINAVAQIVGLLFPVLNLDDPRLIAQPAPRAKLGYTPANILSVEDEALPGGADDEALVPVQQGFQQFLSIAAPIHCPDAPAMRVCPDQIDTG